MSSSKSGFCMTFIQNARSVAGVPQRVYFHVVVGATLAIRSASLRENRANTNTKPTGVG
jgi:hypothetical protein